MAAAAVANGGPAANGTPAGEPAKKKASAQNRKKKEKQKVPGMRGAGGISPGEAMSHLTCNPSTAPVPRADALARRPDAGREGGC